MTMEEEDNLEFSGDFSFSLADDQPDTTEIKHRDNENTSENGTVSKYEQLEEKIARKRDALTFVDDAKAMSKKEKKEAKKAAAASKRAADSNSDGDDQEDAVVEEEGRAEYFDNGEGLEVIKASSFAELNLSRALLKGLTEMGFSKPTAIQNATIPVALMGKDICGGAVTGSGKTAAFLIPIVERLLHRAKHSSAASRVLVLLPTRELAIQCHEVAVKMCKFTDIRASLAAGGLPMRQQEVELRTRPEIIIATPGRLIDHLRNSPSFTLDSVEVLVLDEADRMLEDGFEDELNEIIRHCPRQRQTILFSATMTDNVTELIRLSLKRPVKIFVDSNTTIARALCQEFVRIREDREEDRLPIMLALCRRTCPSHCIVFLPTKDLAHRFRLILGLAGLRAAELHGGLSQAERMDALERFKQGQVDFLTATDVAARGLDIAGVRYVLNHSMPANYKLYLHRVGRTARAGQSGMSITLVGEGADRKLLKMVIKNSTQPVKHRQLTPAVIDQHRANLSQMRPALDDLLAEEAEAKLMQKTEAELERAQNLLTHTMDIAARPKKTWFQSTQEKVAAKQKDQKLRGAMELKLANKQQNKKASKNKSN